MVRPRALDFLTKVESSGVKSWRRSMDHFQFIETVVKFEDSFSLTLCGTSCPGLGAREPFAGALALDWTFRVYDDLPNTKAPRHPHHRALQPIAL